MPLAIKNFHTVDRSGLYIVETNVDIPLRTATKSTPDDPLLVRANVYRPKAGQKFPVLVTYGPCKSEWNASFILIQRLNAVNRW